MRSSERTLLVKSAGGSHLHSGLIRLNGGRIFMFDVRGSACGLTVDPTFVAKETLERLEASGFYAPKGTCHSLRCTSTCFLTRMLSHCGQTFARASSTS